MDVKTKQFVRLHDLSIDVLLEIKKLWSTHSPNEKLLLESLGADSLVKEGSNWVGLIFDSQEDLLAFKMRCS